MHTRSTMRRHVIRVSPLAAVMILSACTEHDQPQPLAPASMRPHYSFSSRIQSTTTFNTYTADVSLAVIAPIQGVVRADSINTVSFHLRRTLDNSNVWTTEMTLQQAPSFPVEPSALPVALPVRMVMREAPGSSPQYYDSTGALVQIQLPDTAALLANSIAAPTNGGVAAMRASGGTPSGSVGVPSFSTSLDRRTLGGTNDTTADGVRSWLDNVVITRAASRRLHAHLARMYGQANGRVGRGERYSGVVGEEMREVIWDPDVGAPAEENIVSQGRLVRHVTHSYARVNDSVWVRNQTAVEMPMPGGLPGIRRVVSSLNNVTVEQRRGQ
jgi:hypothetical protein